METDLLELRDLSTYFYVRKGIIKAVDGVSLRLRRKETLGIVGESGCGKSVTVLSILRLISPPGRIVKGEILLNGKDLLKVPLQRMQSIRGKEISMIFQDPMTSLNPVFTIGRQISETVMAHQDVSQKEAAKRSIDMLNLVGIDSPEKRIRAYPHQLSGGQRQRVMIGMALSCRPSLLIADEPTTALDVTIQAQIIDLLLKLKEDQEASIILITHNFGLVAQMAQWVLVMYAGKVVEEGTVHRLFKKPLHPYTQGLLQSIPYVRRDGRIPHGATLPEIPGFVPSLLDLPEGCSFYPRCSQKIETCTKNNPLRCAVEEDHFVSCWLFER